jgi:uncharacterized protein (TIGR00369 family)
MPQTQREITLRFLAEPTDINVLGKVHGGAVMKWIDLAGATCAAGWSGQTCVTVYVGGIRFYKPILVGNLVEVHAKVIHTGRTSIHIAIDVQAADPRKREFTRTTRCITVFVGLDANGVPTQVPAWKPETPDDLALQEYAVKMMELGKSIHDLMPPV